MVVYLTVALAIQLACNLLCCLIGTFCYPLCNLGLSPLQSALTGRVSDQCTDIRCIFSSLVGIFPILFFTYTLGNNRGQLLWKHLLKIYNFLSNSMPITTSLQTDSDQSFRYHTLKNHGRSFSVNIKQYFQTKGVA